MATYCVFKTAHKDYNVLIEKWGVHDDSQMLACRIVEKDNERNKCLKVECGLSRFLGFGKGLHREISAKIVYIDHFTRRRYLFI